MLIPSEHELQDLQERGLLHDAGYTFTAEEMLQMPDFTLDFLQKRKKGKMRVVGAPTVAYDVADTHAHLEMLKTPEIHLARCAFYGVTFVCSITDPVEDVYTTLSSVDGWVYQAKDLLCCNGLSPYGDYVPDIRVAMGVHPHNAKDYTKQVETEFIGALKNPRVCAIGEVGLDYHYDLSPRNDQKRVFRRQIQLAHETGLPLILHMREAHDDGLAILREEGFPQAGVLLHCFNLDRHVLKPWIEAGCHVAFGGPLTFHHSDDIQKAALSVPLDHLLTETDSPFMTPEPMRGTECGPEHTIFTASLLARLCKKEASPANPLFEEKFLACLCHNARSLLDRDLTVWQKS